MRIGGAAEVRPWQCAHARSKGTGKPTCTMGKVTCLGGKEPRI